MTKTSDKLAVSPQAATKIFIAIAASSASVKFKGRLMTLAAEMMADLSRGSEKEFVSLPGGAEIYEMIATAALRSARSRAAAAKRRLIREQEGRRRSFAGHPAKVPADMTRPEDRRVLRKPDRQKQEEMTGNMFNNILISET